MFSTRPLQRTAAVLLGALALCTVSGCYLSIGSSKKKEQQQQQQQSASSMGQNNVTVPVVIPTINVPSQPQPQNQGSYTLQPTNNR